MSKLKLYPLMVNDFIPFICLVVGDNDEQVIKQAELKFPALKDMGDFEILDPISLDEGSIFVIDPELYILNENDDVKYWLNDGSEYDITNEDSNLLHLFNDDLPTEESEEQNVKLSPAKANVQTVGNKSTKKDKDEKNDDKEKDETFWV